MHILTSADDLAHAEEPFVLLDARAGSGAAQRYLQQHLKAARFVDVDVDLADTTSDPSVGGRHPLPTTQLWCRALGRLGVTPDTPVVVYDESSGALAAARAWWMLRAIGHRQVSLLDGGLQAALAVGYPTSTGEEPGAPGEQPYPLPAGGAWLLPTRSIEEVEGLRLDPHCRLLDVRSPTRYRGDSESLDPIAGHIPGALNLPYAENLDENGRFLPAERLAQHFNAAIGEVSTAATTVYCGSGVTACHSLFAMELAGLRGAALYVGSWSQWCRRDLPRAVVVSPE